MPLLLNLLILIFGLILLAVSSDFLIKTSVKLACLLKLSTLFIGLILVAFGTSCPEAAVSIVAIVKKYKDIALGNIVGSNIANIGLVLGLSGLLRPLKIDTSLFRREIPIMLLSCVFLFIFCLDGEISRWEGLVFILGFILFCFFSYKGSRLHDDSEDFELSGFLKRIKSKIFVFFLFFVSLLFLVVSANLMVNSGVNIAKIFGISPWLIAVTVFAVGTSLPELAASISAALKKVPSISIGNVIGSNIFNILLVLGLVSLVRPITVERSILRFELPLLIVFSIGVSLFMRTKNTLSRWEAGLLFLSYIVFIVLLIVR